MEKNIKRINYYSSDRYGFAIYLVSRLYNDLKTNENLFNALNDEKYDSIKIYLFKITLSHLKEALKLFDKLKNSPYYTVFFNDVIINPENKQILDEISDELEKPKLYPNTINSKYLSIRNDIFHYGTDNDDYEEYKKIQIELDSNNVDVKIGIVDGKYVGEIGVDFPKIKSAFDKNKIEEIEILLKKIFKLCRNILTDYNKRVN